MSTKEKEIIETLQEQLEWIDDEDRWLTIPESLHNAQIVANYFAGEWTMQAISALCGNMRVESSINPNVWEFGYGHDPSRGYGLVQWTPATKYIDWATANGLPWQHGNSQLARIEYEWRNEVQWIPISDYNYMTFGEFTQSTHDVDYLTPAFTWSYERPSKEAGEESMRERIAFAELCMEQLDFGGGTTPGEGDRERTILLSSILRRNTNMRRMGVRGRR